MSSHYVATETGVSMVLLIGLGVLVVALVVGIVAIVAAARGSRAAAWGLALAGLAVLAAPIALVGAYRSRAETGTSTRLVISEMAVSGDAEVTTPSREPTSAGETAAPPAESLIYPLNRPQWVVQPSHSSQGGEAFTVSSDPFATRSEALSDLNHRLAQALKLYVVERQQDPRAGDIIGRDVSLWKDLLNLPTSAAAAAQVTASEGALLDDRVFVELVTFPQPVGEMYQVHAHVAVNEPFLNSVDARWRAAQSKQRVMRVGAAAVAVIGGLLLLSVVLRIMPRVASKRSRRLQSA